MKAIIDARNPGAYLSLFSVSMLERLLRQLHESGVTEAHILARTHASVAPSFRSEFALRYPMRLSYSDTNVSLLEYAAETNHSDVLLFEAHVLHDLRIVRRLINSDEPLLIADDTQGGPCAARFGRVAAYDHHASFSQSAILLAEKNKIQIIRLSEMQSYVRFLRRYAKPILCAVTPESNLKALENAMYEDTFKGGMEWIAVYGYKIPVRELTRWAAKSSVVTPNAVTALATIGKLAAIPFFFMGSIGWALISFWVFTIGDSLDGKLARMTVRFSETADRVDHLTSAPARMLWHLGLTWHMSGGNLWTTPLGFIGLWFSFLPQIDKFGLMYFNWKFGRSPIDYTPLDIRVHLFTARRNDMALLTLGYLTGYIIPAFYGMMAWMYLTWLWHVIRISWFSFFNPNTRGSAFKKHHTSL